MKWIPWWFLAGSMLCVAGVEGEKAPELKVDEWVSLPEGMKSGPSLHKDWQGKVVYLYFFQSWCPGCHSSGFPTLKKLESQYSEHPEVRFATVQTVFEGYAHNTPDAARRIIKRYKLENMPVGQSGARGRESPLMEAFETRGTPWTVIIGKDGKVAFEGFHLKPDEGKKLINKLLKERG